MGGASQGRAVRKFHAVFALKCSSSGVVAGRAARVPASDPAALPSLHLDGADALLAPSRPTLGRLRLETFLVLAGRRVSKNAPSLRFFSSGCSDDDDNDDNKDHDNGNDESVGDSRHASIPGTQEHAERSPREQDFLDTVSLVLELVPVPSSTDASRTGAAHRGGKHNPSPQLLRLLASAGDADGKPESPADDGSWARRRSADADGAPGPSQSRLAGADAGSACPGQGDGGREVLMGWVFRPLLSDAFAMASLTQALAVLGMGGRRQAHALVRDLTRWFLELPAGRAADITVGREAQNCPVLRWLKGLILLVASSSPDKSRSGIGAEGGRGEFGDDKAASGSAKVVRRVGEGASGRDDLFGDVGVDKLDAVLRSPGIGGGSPPAGDPREGGAGGGRGAAEDGGDGRTGEDEGGSEVSGADEEEEDDRDVQAEVEAMLRPMYDACASSAKLENAMMLAVTAAEALSACRGRLQESSLGSIVIDGGEAWLTLARRLRFCLFADHRLYWEHALEDRCVVYLAAGGASQPSAGSSKGSDLLVMSAVPLDQRTSTLPR